KEINYTVKGDFRNEDEKLCDSYWHTQLPVERHGNLGSLSNQRSKRAHRSGRNVSLSALFKDVCQIRQGMRCQGELSVHRLGWWYSRGAANAGGCRCFSRDG